MTKTTTPESQTALLARHKWKERSYAVIVAWQAGELTEMEASKLIGKQVIDNREHLQELIEVAKALSIRFRETSETLKDDLDREIMEKRGFRFVPMERSEQP